LVRGDLQQHIKEDRWSPTISFCALKLFLAHAARLHIRVQQMDYIWAFLQAQVHSWMFVKLSTIYGSILPEFSQYCGTPL